MKDFYRKHESVITLLALLLFWMTTCLFFARFSVLRPICSHHLYKEYCCVAIIASVVLFTKKVTIPKLFNKDKHGLFWLCSLCTLLLAAMLEVLLVRDDIMTVYKSAHPLTAYLSTIYILVFLRDFCFFLWFLIVELYVTLKKTFKKKQRASVMEHQTVQFTLSDSREVAVPLDQILYIQETEHNTQVCCTADNTLTISESFSYCKEMIPSSLWALDGPKKMVFHSHLAEYVQSQQPNTIRGIKTVFVLSGRKYQIFEIIQQNPDCQIAFIKENLPVKTSQRTMEREISDLQNKQLIEHVGSKKDGGFRVCSDCIVLQN